MSERALVQTDAQASGQSQADRSPPELDPAWAPVDGRTPDELYAFLRRLAPHIAHAGVDSSEGAGGDWAPFFPDVGPSLAAWLAAHGGAAPPHLALVGALLRLYRVPQALADGLAARHLDFHLREVLRLARRAPAADHAHVVVALKKGAPSAVLGPEHRISGGKDAAGVERLYAPVAETVVGTARVDGLRSIFRDRAGGGTVRFAPVADSADGLGAPLDPAEPRWRAFGHAGLPAAEVGFAVAAPVLRLASGARRITLRLRVGGDVSGLGGAAGLTAAFAAHLTGPEGWFPADGATATLEGDVLRWELTLGPEAPAVVDHDAAVHGYAYAVAAPVVQLLLRGAAPNEARAVGHPGYDEFSALVVRTASVAVEVSGALPTGIETDAGAADPTKPFLAFGAEPAAGARLAIRWPEALGKRLSVVRVALRWKDAPQRLADRYAAYGAGVSSNGHFTAAVSLTDGRGTRFVQHGAPLFAAMDARQEQTIVLSPGVSTPAAAGAAPSLRALGVAAAGGIAWAARDARQQALLLPVLASLLVRPRAPEVTGAITGAITVALERSFLHAEYRRKYVEAVLAQQRPNPPALPQEPYTPTVLSLAVGYEASSGEVSVSSAALEDFASPELQFHHVTPFGPRREHGYARRRLPFVAAYDVPLLPQYPDAGELLIGLAGAGPRDAVTLLLQCAPGSADPDAARESVTWSVLCDDHWRPLAPDERVRDTTNGLLASGIVQVVLPAETTTTNSSLPAGRAWLRAAVRDDPAAVCQLIGVFANAVEVRFQDRGNDPAHLRAPLPAHTLTKLRTPVAAVKAVAQPFASFGGRPAEDDATFRVRAAERFRHHGRCVTAWDYERTVLDEFPELHRVRCLQHARPGSWHAPGHVLLVVVPDLRNRTAVDPLRPRADADTLARVAAHVQARCGMGVRLHVRNPRYQRVQCALAVRLRPGFGFAHYRGALDAALVRALSPWAFDGAAPPLGFGGAVYRSALLDLVEALPYVDYVTDFRMLTPPAEDAAPADMAEARPVAPDTILVSAGAHLITEVST